MAGSALPLPLLHESSQHPHEARKKGFEPEPFATTAAQVVAGVGAGCRDARHRAAGDLVRVSGAGTARRAAISHTKMHKEPPTAPRPHLGPQIMKNKGLGGGAGRFHRSTFPQLAIKPPIKCKSHGSRMTNEHSTATVQGRGSGLSLSVSGFCLGIHEGRGCQRHFHPSCFSQLSSWARRKDSTARL